MKTKSDKNMISSIKMIGQLDKKFICVKNDDQSHNKLYLFDQHAIHERIRLEQFIQSYFTNPNKLDVKMIYNLNNPVILETGKNDFELLAKLKEKLNYLRIKFTMHTTKKCDLLGKIHFKYYILVETIPKILTEDLNKRGLLVKEKALEEQFANNLKKIVASLIKNFLKEYKEHGDIQKIPKVIFDILCSKACHGAIKFGNILNTKEMVSLLHNLSECRLPYICAHGRPSLVCIWDFDKYTKHELLKPYNFSMLLQRKQSCQNT